MGRETSQRPRCDVANGQIPHVILDIYARCPPARFVLDHSSVSRTGPESPAFGKSNFHPVRETFFQVPVTRCESPKSWRSVHAANRDGG